ncbi:hypothetical protein [Halobellus litoreus]|uniref:Uncharacterized protein n=1 Tax=Halobellus litoreus TaxID=755310 RepID=A0ABD6DUX2_9EURY|nr:hypothetical protein [Halobellus litoreus]
MPMRQLRACDFCGDDAAGVYEVLPPELSPTEAEQRRVVLCENCLSTLEGVVDPLLDRLGVDRDADADAVEEPPSHDDETSKPAAASAGAEATADAKTADTEATTDETTTDAEATADATTADATPSDSDSASDDTGAEGAASDADSPNRADSPHASETPDRPSAFNAPEGFTDIAESDEIDLGSSPDDPRPDSSANGNADAAPTSDSPDRRDDDVAADGPDRETASDPSGDGIGAEPDDFRTVMRLLGNREFPIGRNEVVELAAGAYDLDDAHVERIIDHAIDRGVLTDEGGTLTRS